MAWFELFAVAVALAADAFAVAVVAGLTLDRLTRRHVFRLAFHFGLFQALMPVVGWAAGRAVHGLIASADHWIAFGLLLLVGGRMVRDAGRERAAGAVPLDPTRGWQLVLLSVATSIDALAVGLSLAMVDQTIVVPALVIGLVACVFTAAGMALGRRIGAIWSARAECAGGVILIGIGLRILLEHLAG